MTSPSSVSVSSTAYAEIEDTRKKLAAIYFCAFSLFYLLYRLKSTRALSSGPDQVFVEDLGSIPLFVS